MAKKAVYPVVKKNVESYILSAAETYVDKYINANYEDEFIVLDSQLMHLSVTENEESENVVHISYAYFQVNIEDLKRYNFSDVNFVCESIDFYESDVTSSNLGFGSNAMGGGNPCIDFSEYSESKVEKAYAKSISSDKLDDLIFSAIENNEGLYGEVFNLEEVWAEETAEELLELINSTIAEIDSGTINLNSQDAWWYMFGISDSNLDMFRRFLPKRAQELSDEIRAGK